MKEGKLANANRILEKGVRHFFALAGDEGLNQGLTSIGGQFDCSAIAGCKVFGTNLLTIDQGKNETIGNECAELLDEVEGQAGPTGAIGMEKSDIGVEAGGHERCAAIVGEERVDEREQGVHAIKGWTPGATCHREVVTTGWANESGKGREVDPCGIAFVAANGVEVRGLRECLDMLADQGGGALKGGRVIGGVAISRGAEERMAGIVKLARHECTGERCTPFGLIGAAELFAAEQQIP